MGTAEPTGSWKGERGAAMIVVLILAAVLAILTSSMFSVSLTDRAIAASDAEVLRAFNAAEAGIEHAIAQLHDVDPDTALSGSGVLLSDAALGASEYSATVSNNLSPRFPTAEIPADSGGASDDTDGYLLLTSVGRSRHAERSIEVIVEMTSSGSSSGPFQYAAFGLNKLKGSNSLIFGSAGTNGDMVFSGSAPKVHGDAQAVGTISDGYVTGTATEGADPVSFPPLACPAAAYGPPPSGFGYSFDPSTGKLAITGPVTFDSGTYFFSEISKSGGHDITVPMGANVQIYISKKLAMSGGGFTNLNGTAETLQLWGCDSGSGGFTVTGPQTVWMTIYAPTHKVKFTGEGDRHGSFIGYEWENSGPGNVYYDNGLSGGGGSGDVVLVPGTWRELF